MSDFNSTITGHRHTRFNHLDIAYVAPMTVRVVVTKQDHVLLDDGTYTPVAEASTEEINLGPQDFATMQIALRDLNSDVLLGQTLPLAVVFLGVTSAIRQAIEK